MTTIFLYNYHFSRGSVLIHHDYYVAANEQGKSTKYPIPTSQTAPTFVLQEDITFSPNNMKQTGFYFLDSGIPTKSKDQNIYNNNKAFGIGFFAAIIIYGNNITIDLNGKTLAQSPEHYLRQRFFSLIELAAAPFNEGQGPHDFTDKLVSASHITIKNGTLGLSSHHGIHGNNVHHAILSDLTFRDFEVAAIALNGSDHIVIENIHVKRNNQNIPVLGLWSSGIFLLPYLRELWSKHPTYSIVIQGKTLQATELYRSLLHTYDRLAKAYLFSRFPETLQEDKVFGNPSGITPGIAYGILLHEKGIAVNGFPMTCSKTSYNNSIRNVRIENLKVRINEVPALKVASTESSPTSSAVTATSTAAASYVTKHVQVDVVGSVFQTQHADTIDETTRYKGNLIANIQLLIAKAIYDNIRFVRSVKVNSITPETIRWAEQSSTMTLDNKYVFQGDAMHHVIKGIVAMKLDGLYDSILENIYIRNIINESPPLLYRRDLIGVTMTNDHDLDDYELQKKPSHSKATYATDQKTMVRGMSMSCSKHVIQRNIKIEKLISLSRGICLPVDAHKQKL